MREYTMKYIIAVILPILSASCATNFGTGIIGGATLGASMGSLSGAPGAIIGSAAGLIAGGLFGVALDSQERKVMERSSPRTVERMDRGDPITINDVIKLSQAGVSDDTIISYIVDSGSTYKLSNAQIRRMQDNGVSQRVINYMIDSGR